MVGSWCFNQTDLADDLRPEPQGCGYFFLVKIKNVGPAFACSALAVDRESSWHSFSSFVAKSRDPDNPGRLLDSLLPG
jgi:hypothetical protein